MIAPLGHHTVTTWRRVRIQEASCQGIRTEPSGTKSAELEVEIDLEALRKQIGTRPELVEGRAS